MSNPLTDSEKRALYRAERTPNPPASPELRAEAANSRTVMQHERVLRRWSIDQLAQTTGIGRLRLIKLENGGTSQSPTLGERVALEAAFHNDADVLLSTCSSTNLARLKPLI